MISKVSVALLLLASAAASAGEIPGYPFIFVVGKADIDTPPNIARCSLTIRDREADAGKAASVVDERLKTVLKTFAANKIDADDIESFSIEKGAVTDDSRSIGTKQVTILGYDVWRHVKFKARQLDGIPPIESAMLRAPNITDFECEFDRTDRAAMEGDLQTQALLSAREQADKMAASLGRHVVAPVAVSKVPLDSLPAYFGLGVDIGGMDRLFKRSVSGDGLRPDELLVPATIDMAVTVNVLFKMD